MKKLFLATLLASTFLAAPTFAHHPAADIVDEETYAMIDALVADTPHADLTFDDMGGRTLESTVTASSLRVLENMIDDGLLEYASMLEGDVNVDISFSANGDVTMTITQRP